MATNYSPHLTLSEIGPKNIPVAFAVVEICAAHIAATVPPLPPRHLSSAQSSFNQFKFNCLTIVSYVGPGAYIPLLTSGFKSMLRRHDRNWLVDSVYQAAIETSHWHQVDRHVHHLDENHMNKQLNRTWRGAAWLYKSATISGLVLH
jgi:hypothetical protein